MRLIDADALEKDGWMMNRIVQVDKNTMSYQTKKPTDFPAIEPEPKWIPCSEGLPEKAVLCCDDRGDMIIGYPYADKDSDTGFSAESDDTFLLNCVAWMSLPMPYEGRTE